MVRWKDRWWLGFVECTGFEPRFTFRPALAKSASGAGWDSALELVGADRVHQQTEGTLLTQREGQLWLIASDGDARDFPIYTLAMDRVDSLKADYPSNIPHPLVIEADGSLMMLTFDGSAPWEQSFGYGTHGDIVIQRAEFQ